jgi:uncharacterized YccA/Bax inhibitor family protein
MQSNNPVFRRSEEFQRGGANMYGNQTYAGNGAAQGGYGQPMTDPSQWSVGTPGAPGYTPEATSGPMTIDSVVQKTAITLGLVIVSAAVTWLVTGDITATSVPGGLVAALTLGSLAAFGLSMVNSFKRVVSPALVMAFAVAEGVALGGFSKFIDSLYSSEQSGNLVIQAVVGTFAAFAGTLAAYKFFNIQVGQKFRMFVIAAVFGMVGLSVLELVLGLFGSSFGLFGFGSLGILTAVAGLVLGVFMLILDFDFVEQGIANRIPERESWRAAFALTVSLVWIYTNLLRLLAIFSDN